MLADGGVCFIPFQCPRCSCVHLVTFGYQILMKTECRPQFAFTWRGVQYTWNRLPQGWKHSPTICHGLIQTALEKGEAPEQLQYIDDIIVWGNTAEEVFEKGKKIIQILLKAGFAIKESKVKGPAQEIQFWGIKWHKIEVAQVDLDWQHKGSLVVLYIPTVLSVWIYCGNEEWETANLYHTSKVFTSFHGRAPVHCCIRGPGQYE
ncbi:uncharacterized protein LOC142036030 isoform X1 [Buteo buteo]|uniref:uncharacterized protein LOC142036030 isoform X1 n=1 Tax=Buteo buteo TaxID=30397 RepID=UPI003EB6BA34